MVTSLGKFLRKLRIDNGEILADMADRLKVTASFISAVENGKKRIPADWETRICNLYNLDEEQAEKLAQAIAEAENAYKLDFYGVNDQNRQAAVSFARKFAELDEEQIEAIRKILQEKK